VCDTGHVAMSLRSQAEHGNGAAGACRLSMSNRNKVPERCPESCWNAPAIEP
jgi:hypothetical protein